MTDTNTIATQPWLGHPVYFCGPVIPPVDHYDEVMVPQYAVGPPDPGSFIPEPQQYPVFQGSQESSGGVSQFMTFEQFAQCSCTSVSSYFYFYYYFSFYIFIFLFLVRYVRIYCKL